MCALLSHSAMSDSLRSMDCSLTGSSVYGDSAGKSTGVGAHVFLQGIIPTQGLNSGLLHCRQILYHLSQQRSMYVVLCFLSQCQINYAAAAKSIQSCPTLCDPWTAAYQASPSMGFSRQEHWSGLPFPYPMHESGK